jgi:hypothetical protein
MSTEPIVDVAAVAREGMDDPEFSREMRFFDGRMKIELDGRPTVLEFSDGALVGASTETPDEDCKIVVRGDRDQWSNLLEPLPKPFYQCLQTTAVKHGLYMSTTNETFAYLPALNRLVVLMREARSGKGR